MKPCNRSAEVQDYLDGLMSDENAPNFRGHLAGCESCAAELALYTRVFAALESAATFDPSTALTERILDSVLPSRMRRRQWVNALGWTYAGTLAGSLAAAAVWTLRPGSLHALTMLSATASHRLVQLVLFTLNAASFAAMSLANGWSLLAAAGARLAPVTRTLAEVVSHPTVLTALGPAVAACAAVLWWMHARSRSANGGRHVGVLGF